MRRSGRCVLLPLLLLAMLTGCQSDPDALWIAVRSDLVPGEEVSAVRCRAEGGAAMERFVGALDLLAAPVVCTVTAERAGPMSVEVELLDPSGRVLTSRPLRVVVRGLTVVTLPITRDCRSVTCPGAGAPAATACLGGTCVDPTCTEEDSSGCAEAPECVDAAGCDSFALACGAWSCVRGVCFVDGRTSCGDGLRCAPEAEGCVERTALDGGTGLDGGTMPSDAAPACVDEVRPTGILDVFAMSSWNDSIVVARSGAETVLETVTAEGTASLAVLWPSPAEPPIYMFDRRPQVLLRIENDRAFLCFQALWDGFLASVFTETSLVSRSVQLSRLTGAGGASFSCAHQGLASGGVRVAYSLSVGDGSIQAMYRAEVRDGSVNEQAEFLREGDRVRSVETADGLDWLEIQRGLEYQILTYEHASALTSEVYRGARPVRLDHDDGGAFAFLPSPSSIERSELTPDGTIAWSRFANVGADEVYDYVGNVGASAMLLARSGEMLRVLEVQGGRATVRHEVAAREGWLARTSAGVTFGYRDPARGDALTLVALCVE